MRDEEPSCTKLGQNWVVLVHLLAHGGFPSTGGLFDLLLCHFGCLQGCTIITPFEGVGPPKGRREKPSCKGAGPAAIFLFHPCVNDLL